ncbi:transferase [Streptomyces sp. PT12]|nr:transferase [Streptomyces sp. PT12]
MLAARWSSDNLCRRAAAETVLPQGVSSLSTAILTGAPPPGASIERDLRALGFTVRVADGNGGVARAIAAVPAAERVAVVDARFTGHLHSLRLGLTDPRFPAAAVPGALTVLPGARGALTAALAPGSAAGRDGAAIAPGGGGRSVAAPPATDCLPDRLAAGLAAAGTPVHAPDLGTLVATVPTTEAARAEAEAAVAAVDDEAVRLRSAVKSRDGFFTTHFVSPYSRHLARWCARRGLTPNQVTTASLVTALIAAGCAATGTRPGMIAAGALLLVSFVLDCVDGQLARYSLQFSTLGAWLDATFDRAKEYAFYAGLALGAARGDDDVWALALGAMVLQTARHVVDFAFTFTLPAPDPAAQGAAPGGATALSGRLDRIAWTVWLRRVIVLPIGERWALIAVLTALTTPRVTFTVLLIASGCAACYTTAGRLLRSRRLPGGGPEGARALAGLADSGPVAEAVARVAPRSPGGPLAAPLWAAAGTAGLLGWLLFGPDDRGGWTAVLAAAWYALCAGLAIAAPLSRPFDWLVPPLLRCGEYLAVLILAARGGVNGALPAAFFLVAACAYHHYDTVYRLRGGAGAPPRRLVLATGGHEGRVLAVTAAAALWASGQGFTTALTVLGGATALLVLGESIRFWVSSQAPAVHDETGEPA